MSAIQNITYREQLELVAKVAFPGCRLNSRGGFRCPIIYSLSRPKDVYKNDLGFQQVDSYESFDWNPRDDDGDALRLAVILRIDLSFYNGGVEATWIDEDLSETHKVWKNCSEEHDGWNARRAATRSAILMAAVEIGRRMK